MGVGNLLAIRAHERALEADGLPEQETYPYKHGIATRAAFVGAGVVALLPYVLPIAQQRRFAAATVLTLGSLFLLGAARAIVTRDAWWKAGVETLAVGAAVALAAYAAGAVVAAVV